MVTPQRALALANWWEGRKPYDGLTADTAIDIIRDLASQVEALQVQSDELLDLLKRYRTGPPLRHQPHMITHEADAAIAKVKGDTK
jgi:hypothetical protein